MLAAVLVQPSAAAAFAQNEGQITATASQTYVLGPGDVVEVDVLGRGDFKTRTRIRSDGTIVLPFIGVVRAASLSAQELSNQIAAALRSGGIFADPIVSVEIVSYASQYVTVLGAVTSPGLVPVDRAYRVSEILARVGGKRQGGAEYVVLRPTEGAEQKLMIEQLATGGPEQDPIVPPGAKLFIPEAEQFFIYGRSTRRRLPADGRDDAAPGAGAGRRPFADRHAAADQAVPRQGTGAGHRSRHDGPARRRDPGRRAAVLTGTV
jgi:polysaccharide export outer membrane protein